MGTIPQPLLYMFIMLIVAMVPFFVLSMTSYVKISIVLNILRNAIGIQQVPSGMLIGTLSLMLSLHCMSPVFSAVSNTLGKLTTDELMLVDDKGALELTKVFSVLEKISLPFKDFLKKNVDEEEEFLIAGTDMGFFSLLTSFMLSEIKKGFSIGVVIYLPFLVIDLLVANILLGLGMMMLSPSVVSLPCKWLTFVLCDGWFKICQSLVLSYGL